MTKIVFNCKPEWDVSFVTVCLSAYKTYRKVKDLYQSLLFYHVINNSLEALSLCCLGSSVLIVLWAVAGFGRFSLTSRFSVNCHLGHSRAWISACSPTAALLHCCFPSNLSTTTQGAMVKLRGTSLKCCTLLQCSVWNSKTTSAQDAWSTNCSGVCWEEGMGS